MRCEESGLYWKEEQKMKTNEEGELRRKKKRKKKTEIKTETEDK